MAGKKYPRVTSPKGIARYPWLTKPNTKFDPDGKYSVDLILTEEEAAPFIEMIDKLIDEAFNDAVNDPKHKKIARKLTKYYPYKKEEDEEGNETGNVVVKFKKKATYKDKETGNISHFTIKFFDAKGKPIQNLTELFGGSIIRVNASPSVIVSPAGNTPLAGISLNINAVQVIEKGTGGTAKDYGFGEEDGYEANDIPEAAGQTAGVSTEAGSEEDDF